LQAESQKEQAASTLKRILVLDKDQNRYLTLAELLADLGITLPVSNTEYTLFFYKQAEGVRAGLAVSLLQAGADLESLKALLLEQEPFFRENMKPLFLGIDPGQPSNNEFADNTYLETNIRYLNFPDPTLTIDYALINDLLIITTSKESMYSVLETIY
jgi:hypothetical protein